MSESPAPTASQRPTPLLAVLVLTFVCSLGTGSLWSALPFVTQRDFKFTEMENLWLAVMDAVVYIAAAAYCGRIVKGLRAHLSPRSIILATLILQALVCPLPMVIGVPGIIVTACVTSAASAFMWASIESFLSAGRHGHGLRSGIGMFNVTWTAAVAVAFYIMAPLFATDQTRVAILAIGPCCIIAAICLIWFPAAPAPHSGDAHATFIPAVYRPLRTASRFLIPTSYLLIGSIGPLLPYVIERIEIAPVMATPLAATWLTMRVIAITGMWRLHFWHGKWSTLAVGAGLMTAGFAAAVLANSLPVLVAGLIAFGAGHAILYYASLYYALSVGHGDVGAAGTFEALVGGGYLMGPIASLGGVALGGGVNVVWCVLIVAGLASLLALREWWRWRRHPVLDNQPHSSLMH
ncbi:MAG: MFS transporter [Planctomycetes bacterium]|nr:MFS transporter [Planctomycetota bacterium]